MAIVRRSPHRWWVTLVIIVVSMLATADASAHAKGDKGGRAVACGVARGGPIAPLEDVPVLDDGRGATADQLTEPAPAYVRAGAWITDRSCRSRTLHAPALTAYHRVANSPHIRAAAAVRVVSHTHSRVTRLQNGSILCSRDLPAAHTVAVHWYASDDAASDGDDTSDDDDSQDDQNGDDDTDSPVIAWLQVTTIPCEIALECAPATSWIVPSFPPFLTFQPLRC